MKKHYIFFVLLFSLATFAQTPDGFNYQATVRNNAGTLITNQTVDFTFTIIKDSPTGTAVYSQTQTVTTDDLGQVNLVVGRGTPTTGAFSIIDWSSGTYYLGIALNTGSGNVAMGTTQLLSVPYALYAKTAGSTSNNGKTSITLTGNITDAQAAAQIAAEYGPATENIYISNTTGLTAVDLSSIAMAINININSNKDLLSVNLGGLKTLYNHLSIQSNKKLAAMSFPQLTYFGGNFELSGNVLPSSQINAILNKLSAVAVPASGISIRLQGQTPPAPPTGQGITDKASLTAKGYTVTVDEEPANLELVIKDAETQVIIPGATVKLYQSNNSSEVLQTLTSDANGKVLFTGLKNNVQYGFKATKDCKNNDYFTHQINGYLSAGSTATYDVKLQVLPAAEWVLYF